MRRKLTVIAGCALASLLLSPGAAQAHPHDHDNLRSAEACANVWESDFKMTLYYNSYLRGAWRNVGYSVYDFDHLHPGGSNPSYYPLEFCAYGSGAGQRVKNNSAGARNKHYKYTARIYYNSGYKGTQDALPPVTTRPKFVNVYNENASFLWTS